MHGDPELLIARWINTELGITCRADPDLRPDWWADAPLAHVQRGQGAGEAPLSLDDVTLDVNVYAKVADHARDAAHRIWAAMTLQLPLTTFQPSGLFVKHCSATTPPFWAPDPDSYRRAATYRIILHGFVNG